MVFLFWFLMTTGLFIEHYPAAQYSGNDHVLMLFNQFSCLAHSVPCLESQHSSQVL